MTEHDRSNLSFLLNSTPDTLADWYKTASKDDLDYAQELLASWKVELSNMAFEAAWESVEQSLNRMSEKFSDATALLKKINKKI